MSVSQKIRQVLTEFAREVDRETLVETLLNCIWSIDDIVFIGQDDKIHSDCVCLGIPLAEGIEPDPDTVIISAEIVGNDIFLKTEDGGETIGLELHFDPPPGLLEEVLTKLKAREEITE